MEELNNKALMNVSGGAKISAAMLNAASRLLTTFVDLGRSLGTAIRRLSNGSVCPI